MTKPDNFKRFIFTLLVLICLGSYAAAQTIKAELVSGSISACAGSFSSEPNIQSLLVQGENLVSGVLVSVTAGFEISLNRNSGYTNSLTMAETNGTLPFTAIYVRSASDAPAGNLKGSVFISSPGAVGQSAPVSGIIKAVVPPNNFSNQIVANGTSTTAVNLNATGNTYYWSNNTPSIGLAVSGTNNVPAFTAVNNGSTPVTATITATPVSSGQAFVTGEVANSISILNLSNNQLSLSIGTGNSPIDNVVSADGSTIYYINSGSTTLTAINAASTVIKAKIILPDLPAAMALNADGSRLYLSSSSTGTVTAVNTTTNSIITTIATGAGAGDILVSPDAKTVYVANSSENSVSVISAVTNSVTTKITAGIGKQPSAMANSLNGQLLYVANMMSGTVSVINTTTNTVIATINTGSRPTGLSLSRDGSRLYVSILIGYVSVFNTTDFSQVAKITVGQYPNGSSVSLDGNWLYVVNLGDNTVSVVNTVTNQVVTTARVGVSPYAHGNFIYGGVACGNNSQTFTITVNPSNAPTITSAGSLASLQTSPGLPSPATNFSVSGNHLTSGIVITPPNGFEVSTDNVTFSDVLKSGASGTIGPVIIYIRLKGNDAVGSYIGNIKLSSTGAPDVNVLMPQSTVAGVAEISPVTATGIISACLGVSSTSPNIQQFSLSGNNLTGDITATAPPGFELSLTAGNGYSNALTIPQTGGSIKSVIIFVRSSASAPIGAISGNVILTSADAISQNVAVNGIVKSLPVVNPVTNQIITAGSNTTAINFSGTSQQYNWTNDTPGIGISTSGTGNIPSFTASNIGSSPVAAIFTVTPVPAGFVYTANANSNSVSVINFGTSTVVATLPVGELPVETIVSPDGNRVFVLNFNSSTISVIDGINQTVIATLAVGTNPVDAAISPDGSKLFVCNEGSNNISVINTSNNTIVATISVGQGADHIIISPDGSHVYVSSFYSNTVSVINTSTNLVEATINGIAQAIQLLLNANGSRLYAASRGSNSIIVINTATNSIVLSIPVVISPMGQSISPDGSRLYVSNMGSDEVSVINTTTNAVIATIQTGNYDFGTAVSSDGKFVYVVDRGSNDLAIINTSTNTVIKTIPISGNLDPPVLSPDGSRLYITDDGSNSVHIINTATNTLVGNAAVGINPLLYPGSFSKGNGCDGKSITFTITVNPQPSAIKVSGVLTALQTTYGTASSPAIFSVEGINLSGGITITPPPGFSVSTNDVTYNNTATISGAGNTLPTMIYLRLTAATSAGNYLGNIVLSSIGVKNVNFPVVTSIVDPAPLFITADGVDKPFETTLTSKAASTEFTATGLQNNETIGSVNINYETGAAAGAPAGVYPGSITASAAAGGNFKASNYSITYLTGSITVEAPPDPTLMASGILSSVNTVYGTASPSASFDVFGTNLAAGILITPPVGFGVSLDNITFTSTVTISSDGTVNNVPVYIRLEPTTNAGNYSGNFILSSFGATNINIAIPVCVVDMAPLTITAIDAKKTYGTVLTAPAGMKNYEITAGALKNGNTIDVVNLMYNAGYNATAVVGTYPGSVQLNGATGGNGFLVSNYNITYESGTVIVVPAALTIQVDNVTKIYGSMLTGGSGSSLFSVKGLQNAETVGSITLTYGAGAAPKDATGTYGNSAAGSDAAGGTFISGNYVMRYLSAEVVVNPAPLTVSADDKRKDTGTPNPALTYTYYGFVNNESEAQLTSLPVINTTALTTSPAGEYPIFVLGATAVNYTITFVPGVLTVNSFSKAPSVTLIFPNTFTPNGDGINDTWALSALAPYTNCSVNVYDRYGHQVYTSIGYGIPWDGRFRGNNLPTGTYYYIIDPKNNMKVISGNVTILR